MNLKRSQQMKERWRRSRPVGRVEDCDYCGGRVRRFEGLGRYCLDCKIEPEYKFDPKMVLAALRLLASTVPSPKGEA